MKILVAILLFLSLYTPSVVKMVAYADCTIQLLAETDPLFCECSKVNYFDQLPFSAEGKDYTLSLNTDWNYLSTTLPLIPHPTKYSPSIKHCSFELFFPSAPAPILFRPPAV